MLGGLQAEFPELDGVDPTAPHPRNNFIGGHPVYEQHAMQHTVTSPDPRHELANVQLQIAGPNAYFVLDYFRSYPESTREQREHIMGYYPPGFLPATHALGRAFTICDHWFSSVPGPTWPNRFFLLSGTSKGRVHMPHGAFDPNLHWYDQDTIFDRLNDAGVSWAVHAGDFPLSLLLVHQLAPKNLARYSDLKQFEKNARGEADLFPRFVFLEPDYLGDEADDDHPPHDVMRGERLIARVYNAIRTNEDLWNSTLLVLLFDEHGGFYDHVHPPAAMPPDEHDYEFDFRQLGVRVPALLISPWVEQAISHTEFDHTSLLRYLIDKWALGPLRARTAAANSIASLIRVSGTPRKDTPERITVRQRPESPPAERSLTGLEKSIVDITEQLQTRSLAHPQGAVYRVARAMANSPHVRTDVRDKLKTFLRTHTDPLDR